jgi:hypothetical protein
LVSEQLTISGTGIYVHKYVGTKNTGEASPTNPAYDTQSATNIQDLLFIENRDRVYDTSVYQMRGWYQVPNQSFDLSQFGIFLNLGTLFMVFHINDMIDIMGRKIMNGDVLELQHLKDYSPLDETIPVALKRYFVVSDCDRASEGYGPTWWPHLWRCKLNPLVDSQEYKDILNTIKVDNTDTPLSQVLSTYDKYININDAVIAQAEIDVPKSGYDTSKIYIKPVAPDGQPGDPSGITADNISTDSSQIVQTSDESVLSPSDKVHGYLTGDGIAPNGLTANAGIMFPNNPMNGDYFLRLDYLPNRLFRFDGARWVKIEDVTRTNVTPGASDNNTQRNYFTANTGVYTDSTGTNYPEKQSLNKVLRPKADN